MERFCFDLSGLVGRVLESPPDPADFGEDTITADIYMVAAEAGIDVNEFMNADSTELATISAGGAPWLKNCRMALIKFRRKVPEATHLRMLAIWTGTSEDMAKDMDAARCLEYAKSFFSTVDEEAEELVDLATCLFDYAYTRQGLDDDLVRVTKESKPPKALVAAERSSKKVPEFDTHLKEIEYELFVVAVKKALHMWNSQLEEKIIQLSSDSIYRIAMHRAGYPVGDSLVSRVCASVERKDLAHPNVLVTVGHSAMGLEKVLENKGLSPERHGIRLVKEFCRTCAGSLKTPTHGCCMIEKSEQETELKYLRDVQDVEAYIAAKNWEDSQLPSIDKEKGYQIRVTPLEGGEEKMEVHLDLWAEGLWQHVVDRDAAKHLAIRALHEDERARACGIRRHPDSRPEGAASLYQNQEIREGLEILNEKARALALPARPGDSTHPEGDYSPFGDPAAVKDFYLKALIKKEEEEENQDNFRHHVVAETRELLAKALCVTSVALGGAIWVFTQSFIAPVVAMVGFVAAYCFTDRKGLKKAEQKALSPAEFLGLKKAGLLFASEEEEAPTPSIHDLARDYRAIAKKNPAKKNPHAGWDV